MLMEQGKGIGVGSKRRRFQNAAVRTKEKKKEPKSLLLMEKAEGIGVGSKGRRLRNISE